MDGEKEKEEHENIGAKNSDTWCDFKAKNCYFSGKLELVNI